MDKLERIFDKVLRESQSLEIVQNAWNNIFVALDQYDMILFDIIYSSEENKILHEAVEEDKFQYCIDTLNNNIDIIIKCLGLDPIKQQSPNYFQKIVSIFSKTIRLRKKELNNILSSDNLIKLSGKIQNINEKFIQGLNSEEREPLLTFHNELFITLNKFKEYLQVYNKINPRKDVISTIEAIKRWKISDPKFKKDTINDWEKIDIPNWKKKN
jgi:hypothetical protein